MYVLYIDNSILTGPNKRELDEIIEQMEQTGPKMTYEDGVEDCLGVLIQFPPEMVENCWRYGGELVTKIIQTGRGLLSCAYTTQLLHSTVEVCWNNNDSYFIWIKLCAKSLDK